MERVKGIEPSCEAWKASVLPLNYTRLRFARLARLEVAESYPARLPCQFAAETSTPPHSKPFAPAPQTASKTKVA